MLYSTRYRPAVRQTKVDLVVTPSSAGSRRWRDRRGSVLVLFSDEGSNLHILGILAANNANGLWIKLSPSREQL